MIFVGTPVGWVEPTDNGPGIRWVPPTLRGLSEEGSIARRSHPSGASGGGGSVPLWRRRDRHAVRRRGASYRGFNRFHPLPNSGREKPRSYRFECEHARAAGLTISRAIRISAAPGGGLTPNRDSRPGIRRLVRTKQGDDVRAEEPRLIRAEVTSQVP